MSKLARKGWITMNVEKIDSQAAVLHLPATVEDEDAPKLRQILQTLYEEGFQFLQVDFTVTEKLREHCLGILLLYHKRLTERGGELTFVNVKSSRLKHVFGMIDLRRVMTIEEID